MKFTLIVIDTPKHVFTLHGVDEQERPVLRREIKRHQAEPFFAKPIVNLSGHERNEWLSVKQADRYASPVAPVISVQAWKARIRAARY